jgi:glycosyltransferase involved in cell wall biosynthesis
MMRVALDVTATITGSTGVARYARQLEAALAVQGVETVPYAIGRARHPVSPGVRHLAVPLRVVQRSWAWTGRPRPESLVAGVDVVHALDLAPPPSRLPVVATVQDLTAVDYPDLHPRRRVAQQRAQLRALSRADVILAISAATRDRLAAHGFNGDTIVVSPLGRTPLPLPAATRPPERPYLLAVGEVTRRKGHDVLLRAFAGADLDGITLVVAGPDGFDAGFRHQLVDELRLADRVRFLGQVDESTLASLYAGALALCFPSRAEGFGLPVVEAMGASVPVVASDIDALREVAGDSALYVPAGDDTALAEAMARIAGDAPLREQLVARGRARAASFTWARTARITVDAYRRVLS